MLVGERIRAVREVKNFSHGDIEKPCGLRRVCTSRMKNGHTAPSVETLEKFARALEIPLYQFSYEGKRDGAVPHLRDRTDQRIWGTDRKDIRVGRSSAIFLRAGTPSPAAARHGAEDMARRRRDS